MIEDHYELECSDDFKTFSFHSKGPSGIIKKIVKYTEIDKKDHFNLGFGDEDELGYINDLAVTNNKDSKKVLATVARTLYLFTNRYPEADVVASGSTLSRNRLYQMGIANNLKAIEKDFEISGRIHKTWEPFRKNITYNAFSVRRKS